MSGSVTECKNHTEDRAVDEAGTLKDSTSSAGYQQTNHNSRQAETARGSRTTAQHRVLEQYYQGKPIEDPGYILLIKGVIFRRNTQVPAPVNTGPLEQRIEGVTGSNRRPRR